VLFTLAGINTDNGTVLANGSTAPTAATTPVGDSIILAQRTRLTLTTSFVGTDLLRVRLDAGNIPNFSGATISNTNQARLGFDGVTGTTTTPAFNLGLLTYRFRAFDKGQFDITAIGAGPDGDLGGTLVPLSSNAALSRFGAYNPIYRTIGPPLQVLLSIIHSLNGLIWVWVIIQQIQLTPLMEVVWMVRADQYMVKLPLNH